MYQKSNKKIILLSIILAAWLFFLIISEAFNFISESIAFALSIFILIPSEFLWYETCFMTGPNCISNVPLWVNFVGPIFWIIVLSSILYPIIKFIFRILRWLIYRDFSDEIFSLKYWKKIFIAIFIFFFLVLSFIGLENINKSVEDRKHKLATTPEYILKEYYRTTIDYLNGREMHEPYLGNRFVTDNLVNQFNELKTQYPEGIPFNPFICAQDFPEDASEIIFKQIYKDENNAKFEVYIFEKPIIVSLVLGDQSIVDTYNRIYRQWSIDKIDCNR